MLRQLRCTVSGRVQGVLYRDFTRRSAGNFNLTGFVRNLEDGAVEVVAEGDEAKLKEFLDDLKKGSLFSKVKDINTEWREPEGKFSDFKIIHSNFVDRL